MKPTKPNRTGKATAADTILTNDITVHWIIDYFKPTGSILDPAAGKNAFYAKFPSEEKYRCEIGRYEIGATGFEPAT
ncbi:hypothetical protein LCGC14_2375180, partial [marine sediment metagenome]